jgi:hypothetical protein
MTAEEDLAAAMNAWLDAPSGDQPSNTRLAAALAALSLPTPQAGAGCQRCGHSRAEHADAEYSRPWCRHGWAADPAQRAADPCSCGWYTQRTKGGEG